MAEPDGLVHLEDREIAKLSRVFAAGEVLFSEGATARETYFLREGRIRLIRRVGTFERIIRVLQPGEFFSEAALIPGGVHSSTAVATVAGLVLAIEPGRLPQVLASYPALGTRILAQLARRLTDAEDQIEVLLLRDSRSKIVAALLKLAQKAQNDLPQGGGGTIQIAISPLELSAKVGLDVETVKRTVQELRDSDHLRISGEKVEIPDLGTLRELYGLLLVRDQIIGAAH